MGAPNRLPDDHEPDDLPQDRWETYEGRRIDPGFTTHADPARDIRLDTHLKSIAVFPKDSGATLKIFLAVAGVAVLALISYFLFRGSRSSPRSPESPSGRLRQQAPVRPVSAQSVLPLAKLRSYQKKNNS